jgi:K+-sensing histidine kinase KdpD
MSILCQEKGLGLQVDLPEQVWIRGDQKSLRRLMYNILNNAIGYTDHDGTIGVALHKKQDVVVVSVSDTGIADCQGYLFFSLVCRDEYRLGISGILGGISYETQLSEK